MEKFDQSKIDNIIKFGTKWKCFFVSLTLPEKILIFLTNHSVESSFLFSSTIIRWSFVLCKVRNSNYLPFQCECVSCFAAVLYSTSAMSFHSPTESPERSAIKFWCLEVIVGWCEKLWMFTKNLFVSFISRV